MTREGPEENYNVFRWYKSSWGRYTQTDPIGLAAGTNLFAYAVGNPLIYMDPDGRKGKPLPALPPPEVCPTPKPKLPKAGFGWVGGAITILLDVLIWPGDLNPEEFENKKFPCKVCDEKEDDDDCILFSIQEDTLNPWEFGQICFYQCKDGSHRQIYRKSGQPQCKPIRKRDQPWDNPDWEQDLWK